ncbi:hypothetical protein TWF696_001476 [Orbilia brochopaga]|uniref:C2H2-type domain-containing protein n=1 Tax=Orbilia brochopaga TaxID=3140254 RepID=A0AAV9UD76_9PEZI
MSSAGTAVVRPRTANLPAYPPAIMGFPGDTASSIPSTLQQHYHFDPPQWICRVRCCQPGCRSVSSWCSATQLSFYIEELDDDPILCAECIVQYPNLPAEQSLPVWLQIPDPTQQMYRIACRESMALGARVLPDYIADKEELVSPRSPFVHPLWQPATFDEHNRRIYICPECQRDFRKQSRYIRHVSGHINLYVCRHCNQPKARVEDTKNHLIRTCLPRHYLDTDPARFDGDENDIYHYSWHYRWRTNAEFLADSRNNYQHHSLGSYRAIEAVELESDPPSSHDNYYGNSAGYSSFT